MDKRLCSVGWGLQAISALVGGMAGLLTIRLLLRLSIANPSNPVIPALYRISRPFLFPWARMLPLPETPGFVLEWATLVALGTYLAIGLASGFLSVEVSKCPNKHPNQSKFA